MSDRYAYTGPTATVLRSGAHVAPNTPVEEDAFGPEVKAVAANEEEGVEAVAYLPDEREFYEEQGWLVKVEPDGPLKGEALKARARELEIEGASAMNADELRAAVESAEHEAATAAEEA